MFPHSPSGRVLQKISWSIQQFSNITIKISPTESSQFQQIKCALNQKQQNTHSDQTTGSALAAASDIHRKVPTYMANIRRDWLTNQNTDCCFVVIGLVGRQSHSPLQQPKIDPVCQMGPPYWLAPSRCQRIFINIRGQYGNQKNIYIHPWIGQNEVWLSSFCLKDDLSTISCRQSFNITTFIIIK